jgi:hypothetical protein
MLQEALSAHPGAIGDKARARLEEDVAQIRLWNLERTAELGRVLGLLEQARIPAIPYKGPVLAQQVYGDVGLREFVDVDVLVPPAQAPRAIELVEGYESTRPLTPRQKEFMLRTGHDFKLAREPGHVLELQWALGERASGLRVSVPSLFRRSMPVTFAGRTIRGLAPDDLLVVVAAHAGIHLFGRLEWIADVAEVVRVSDDPTILYALTRAESLGLRRMLLVAVATTAHVLDAPIPPILTNAIEADHAVWPLVADLTPIILGPTGPVYPTAGAQLVLSLRLLDDGRARARRLWGALTTPTMSDWVTLPLPDPLWPAYYPIRIGRLITSYLFGDRRPGDAVAGDRGPDRTRERGRGS